MNLTMQKSREVEQSPDGRYVRFDHKLGNGAYKEVFLSYDTETGKEVAWNTVTLARLPANEKKRIRMETEILKELDHPHIINFYHVWENPALDQICFTTEIVTSGTLKQYVHRVRNVKLKVIKKWCRQILTALDYLHSHAPPIIHRDLKCDNIFINGGTGEIRIGDFGLSAARHTTHVESVLGTPEFMAPELYDEHYSEKVDIYSFGMCILEMTTKEYPYEECSNAAQIWKKVSMGQKPEVLTRILNHEVRAFIEVCLMPQDQRLSARELLKHPFLRYKRSDPSRDNITVLVEPRTSPTHRESKQDQQNHLREGIEARDRERLAVIDREKQDRQFYNHSSSSTPNAPTPTHQPRELQPPHHPHHHNNDSDPLSSPTAARPSPSPVPPHHPHHHPHHHNQTPTNESSKPTMHQHTNSVDGHNQQHAPSQHHQQHPHHNQHELSQPNSAQTPPARLGRQVSLPNLVAMNSSGLTHSQSSNTVSSLHQPQPVRSHHLATPHGQGSSQGGSHSVNVSPDLVHVASVVVDVESTHSHFANIALHIHFESGSRRKKQIRFEFDFYRDTSESIAGEMVRALKLPDQERTARLIASNMELKIDPLRIEYYANHSQGSSSSTSESHSPNASPASRSKALTRPPYAATPHDERHPPPHPQLTHSKSSTPIVSPHSHYSTLPSPQHTPNAHGVVTKPLPPHHGTMPQTGTAAHHPPHLPTPKLPSAQPTNVNTTRPQPSGGATKPPHPSATPTQRNGAGGAAVSPNQESAQQKNMGSRRHSHEPTSYADSLPAGGVTRTTSIPHNLSHQQQPPAGSPSSATQAASTGGGLRRSSSTSSLGYMLTPEQASKADHDRLYDEYRLYSIANLKEKIKERMREQKGLGAGEAVELNGILEKNDLIESLIRLTPKSASQAMNQVPPPQSSHVHTSHYAHTTHSPPSPHHGNTRFDDSSHPPSDSSASSTPRIQHHDMSSSTGGSTPNASELRSRAPSVDGPDSMHALLGNYSNMSTTNKLRTAHDSISRDSPNISPSQSPIPSPAQRSMQDRRSDASDAEIANVHHHIPSSHRISNEHYKDREHHLANQNDRVAGPSPLTRSSSSPHDLPDLGRSGKKGVTRESGGSHYTADSNTSSANPQGTISRNFTFPQTGSGHTSPASTSSNNSLYAGSHPDDEQVTGSTYPFPSALHVDVNPISPTLTDTASPALRTFPHPANSAPSSSSANTNQNHLNVSTHAPHSHTPQSPTIPEETSDQDDSAHVLPPPNMNRVASIPLSSTRVPTQKPSPQPHPQPSSANASTSASDTMNPPLGRKKSDQPYSQSVDDLSRLVAPASLNSASSTSQQQQKGSLTPSGSLSPAAHQHHYPTPASSATSAAQHHHRKNSSEASHSASTTPQHGTGSARNSLTPQQQQDDTEEKKKLAERAKLQKKNDAAKAAKMCEDKILAGLAGGNFSFH